MNSIKELAYEIELYDLSKNISEYSSKLNSEGVLYSNDIRKLISKIKKLAIKHQNNFIKTIPQSHESNSKGAAETNPTGFKSIQNWKENLTKICEELDVLKANL